MKRHIKYLLITIFSVCSISLTFALTSDPKSMMGQAYIIAPAVPQDTAPRYPVKKTQATKYEDLDQKTPVDLRTPSNINTSVEYDSRTNLYIFRTKLGDNEIATPFSLNYDEYMDYSLKQSMSNYFKGKNATAFDKGGHKDDFSLKEVKVDLGSLDRIFGPGGVKLKANGYVEATLGIKHQKTDDPTRSERKRSKTTFDFDQDIQVNVNASVGEKINFGLNYDTKAAFDFDSKKIKLGYEGQEDEIIKRIEAGNVSMTTTNSLISGGTSLFGINTELQFGKLRVNTIVSQQESESRTVNTKGSVQNQEFEFKADQYDENRHFFLAEYFRDTYNQAMSKLPGVNSPIRITNIEVWITNKRGNFEQARNIVAFAEIGESKVKNTNNWASNGGSFNPRNAANTLYSQATTTYKGIREISKVNEIFSSIQIEGGQDYEKVESARLLTGTEYIFNSQLGYLSLSSALQADEVLAIAYEYQMGGQTYQVGEFAANIIDKHDPANDKSGALFLKLLKPVSLSPNSHTWDLMMKNVYSLGSNSIQKEGFRLNISYQSDTLGTYITYIPEGKIKNERLLKVLNMDRLDARDVARPNGDGIFDYVEGFTVRSDNGKIYFPVVEPFGQWLADKIEDPLIAQKYIYQELYDTTKTAAQQVAEKNKFKISGTYRGASNGTGSGAVINLNATNVPPGSVRVTAAGVNLAEGIDYIIDYMSGSVTIINQSLVESSTPIQVSLEDRTFSSMQRKTLLGLNLSYDITKDFNVGGTIMHMYEKPLSTKTTIGNESVENTLWGLNASYRTQSQWLTNLIDKLPFVEATQPSQISLNGEFAQMVAGHYTSGDAGGYSYLDDFETSESRIDLKSPYAWTLAALPKALEKPTLLGKITDYEKKRALFAWYMIDPLFTRKNSSLTPQHIKNDKDQLSDHHVREVRISELYPNKDLPFDATGVLPVLNLSFYPNERGPYNLDAVNIDDSNGKLLSPEERWGGITRRMDVRDFEASNIEYVEFWLMDPFFKNDTATVKNKGGKFYINLGEISEDILKDGKKFFENGLPTSGDLNDPAIVERTKWGKVPKRQSTVYAFDNDIGIEGRRLQDVGYNGLSTEEEKAFDTYADYLTAYSDKVLPAALPELLQNPFSALNDPAGDNYRYFRSSYYDQQETSILDRYKYFNGTEGNSVGDPNESYSTAARIVPDVEDIDQDNTMNENESYFNYVIDLEPNKMSVGANKYIVDMKEVTVELANGNTSYNKVKWYQFKVPIREHDKKPIGNIRDFKSIRFMRMYMTEFEQPTHLRFGSLQLVRGDWRVYTNDLNSGINNSVNGTLDVSTVNIEENSERKPVSYVLPPGLSRVLDPSQTQILKENEQAMSLRVTNLEPQDARAIYKNTNFDLRRYKRLQLFTHLEELLNNGTQLERGDITVFIRLGSDYKNNYYEYEIPLSVTPAGEYYSTNPAHQNIVWPAENMFDFSLELLKEIKLKRNAEKRKVGSTISYTTVYSDYDPTKPMNKISILGNPTLAEVNVIMIGVRNNTRFAKSGEVWVNELRLTDFDDKGGWAAQGNVNVALSDIGNINVSGRKETVGFGALDQSLLERRSDDYQLYNVALNLDLGRFLPEKAKVSVPMYYSYSNQKITPEYDPFDTDVTLKESLSLVETKAERDSIKSLSIETATTKSINFTNVKVNIQSKTPMPYDPANFSFGYAFNENEIKNPTTTYNVVQDYKATVNYSYSPLVKTWEPFKDLKKNTGAYKFAKSVGFNYVPSNIAFNSNISRYYTETLTRDIESYSLTGPNDAQFLTWSQSFYWDRDFSLAWDFTRSLKMSFQSGTRAEIEEEYLQVNKKLNRGEYEKWKDVVWNSIKDLGNPLTYRQVARLTYQLPFRDIPATEWINSTAGYNSSYQWDRGAVIDSTMEIGNTINNSITLDFTNRFDLTSLYRKSAFLKKVNDRFDSRRQSQSAIQRKRDQNTKVSRQKRFTQEIELIKDSVYTLKHGLDTKKFELTAKRDGKPYKLKYKKIDNNTIRITNKDSARIQINIIENMKKQDGEGSEFWEDVAQYSARGLMSVRSFSINYSTRNETSVSGFKPGIGDALGQKKSDGHMSPGVGFAFGLDGGENFIDRIKDRGWLIGSDSTNISPAVYNKAEKLEFRAQLEPFKGLKVELNASRESNKRTEVQHMFKNSPRTFGGSFSITTIALSSSFDTGNAKNGYKSKSFQKFLSNRDVIADRIKSKYSAPLPNEVNRNSSDVLVPAFLSAYTGQSVDKISLSAFPSLLSLLPNWTVAYDGLSNIPFIKQQFKSIRINHGYSSFYQVGSYTSHSTWKDGDGFGFIRDVVNGTDIPSSPYNIGSVSISELFNPLIGIESVLNNNMSINTRYNSTRTLNLNISSYQVIETVQKEWVIGLGYRISEFNRIIGLTSRNSKDNVNNDLNIKADLSHRTQQSLIRKIEENFTQATSGTTIITLKLSADYTLSRSLTLRAFFDRIMNEPLITSSGYPTTNSNFGISLKYTLLE